MNKEQQQSLLSLIPTLMDKDIIYESDLIKKIPEEYKKEGIRIGDIRKLLKTLNITLNKGKKEKAPISISNGNNKRNGRRYLTREELLRNREKRRIKYKKVIDLLIQGDRIYTYEEIARLTNVSIGTVQRVKKEFIDNEDRY